MSTRPPDSCPQTALLASGVVVRCAQGTPPAGRMAAVHEKSATAAYAHIFAAHFPLDDAREKWAAHRGQIMLATRGEDLVGFAASTGDEVDGLYVLPAEAEAGVGSALLRALGEVSRLWVLEDNQRGRRWYERRGWHAGGGRQQAYDVWELLYVR